MDRVWEANVVGTAPTYPGGLQNGYPTETGAPTIPGAWWFYQITEEMRAVIVAGGGTPAGGTVNQMSAAIGTMITNVTNLLAPKASPTFTGTVSIPTLNVSGTTTVNTLNVNGNQVTAGTGTFGSSATIGGGACNFYADATNAAVRSTKTAANGGTIYFQDYGGGATYGNWGLGNLVINTPVYGNGAIVAASTLTVGGVLQANTRILLGNGSSGAPSMSFISDGNTDTGFYWGGDGVIAFTTNSGYRGQINTTGMDIQGALTVTGDITGLYSDDRLKTRTGVIEHALAKLATLDTFFYYPNEIAISLGYDKVHQVGVSAQQVQAILPEVVKPAPIDKQYLTVQYEKLVPLVVAGVNEQSAKIAVLEDTIASMAKDIELLKKQLMI